MTGTILDIPGKLATALVYVAVAIIVIITLKNAIAAYARAGVFPALISIAGGIALVFFTLNIAKGPDVAQKISTEINNTADSISQQVSGIGTTAQPTAAAGQ